ncbi:MAG TPA: porin [Kofleriaceae bacterium]
MQARHLLVVAVLSAPALAMAQAADPPAEPEPEPKQEAATPAPAPAPVATPGPTNDLVDKPVEQAKFKWEPFGYLRMQYIAVQNDPNVEFVGRDDGFELQNARVGVRGDLQGVARFTISIDGAVDERAQNDPQGKLRVGLRDAYVDFWMGGDLAIRGGYFQTWVDPNALVADTSREFVDKPIETRGMRSTEGWYTQGLPPGRSLGAAVRMEPEEANKVGLEVAVQNGADEFASNNDNDKPAVSAAVMFKLASEGFIVAAARWNPRTVGDLPFRQDETDIQGSLGAQVNAGAISLGAGGIVQRTTFESTGGPVQNAFGAHAQLMFKLPGRPLAVGYRFGILDPSSLIVTDRVIEHTAGAVAGVPQWRMRVQLQLTHVMEQAARELSNSRIQLAAEVSL